MSTVSTSLASEAPSKRYRLPGIEREGVAQLSLLETALWPLQDRGRTSAFHPKYSYATPEGRKTAHVTVRSGLGLKDFDEFVLWGLLGATLQRRDDDPVLMATPYWMLQHLGLDTGGSQYAELRQSLQRLANVSYENTAFYNPLSKEHEFAAFQFLSFLLPTVGGLGGDVDNARCWRIIWNPLFFRFCQATGGTLLFDLDLYRSLSPAARRLFLKLKDRFWRTKRVFFNVDDLTINGMGYSSERPLRKRKYDLTACIQELLDQRVIALGKGQAAPEDLFLRHAPGVWAVLFHEGEYFRSPLSPRREYEADAFADDPLREPLKSFGIDDAGIKRLLKTSGRALLKQWIRVTDAALHEKPRGFKGFRASPAAFFIDGVQNNRRPPDWFLAHEKRQEQEQFESRVRAAAAETAKVRQRYDQERREALRRHLSTPEGKAAFQAALTPLLDFYRVREPHTFRETARKAAEEHVDRHCFLFPGFSEWLEAAEHST
jgi:hypothetical protein